MKKFIIAGLFLFAPFSNFAFADTAITASSGGALLSVRDCYSGETNTIRVGGTLCGGYSYGGSIQTYGIKIDGTNVPLSAYKVSGNQFSMPIFGAINLSEGNHVITTQTNLGESNAVDFKIVPASPSGYSSSPIDLYIKGISSSGVYTNTVPTTGRLLVTGIFLSGPSVNGSVPLAPVVLIDGVEVTTKTDPNISGFLVDLPVPGLSLGAGEHKVTVKAFNGTGTATFTVAGSSSTATTSTTTSTTTATATSSSVITGVQGYNQNATDSSKAYTEGKALKDTYLVVYGSFGGTTKTATIDGKDANIVYQSPTQVNISLAGIEEGVRGVTVKAGTIFMGSVSFTIIKPVTATTITTAASGIAPGVTTATAIPSGLAEGSKGDDVLALQNILIARGFLTTTTGRGTGYFGKGTAAALKAFQSANGLEATGVVGPKTRDLLNRGGTPALNVTYAASDAGSASSVTATVGSSVNVPDYAEIVFKPTGFTKELGVMRYEDWINFLNSGVDKIRDTQNINLAQAAFSKVTTKLWTLQGVSMENVSANYAGAYNAIVRLFNSVPFILESSKKSQWDYLKKNQLQQVENWKDTWVKEIQKNLDAMPVSIDGAGNRTADTVAWGKVVVDKQGSVVSTEITDKNGPVPQSVVDEMMSRALTASGAPVVGSPRIVALNGWWNDTVYSFVASNTMLVINGTFGDSATVVVKDSSGSKEYPASIIKKTGLMEYDQINITLGSLFGSKLDVYVKNASGVSGNTSIDIRVLAVGTILRLPYPGDPLPVGSVSGTLVKPSITSLSSSSGKAGDTITINGSNFTQGLSVSILPTISGTLTSWFPTTFVSSTQLSFVVPGVTSNVGTGGKTINLTSTSANLVSNSVSFSIIPSTAVVNPPAGTGVTKPTITGLQGFNTTTGSFSSGSAVAGGTLLIYGTFPASGNTVTVGGTSQTVVTESANQINVTLGTATGSLGVKVTNGTNVSNEMSIMVNAPLVTNTTPATTKPVISGVQGYNPTLGLYTTGTVVSGQALVIYGSFDTSGNNVSINGFPVATSYQSTTQLNVPLNSAPAGNATLSVYNSKGVSNTFTFTITAAPAGTIPTPVSGLDIFKSNPVNIGAACTGTAPTCSPTNSCGQKATGVQVCTNGVWGGCSVAAPSESACMQNKCGSATSGSSLYAPTSNLCEVGTASSVNLDTIAKAYIWSCGLLNNGSAATTGTIQSLVCSKPYGGSVNGVCGQATNSQAPYPLSGVTDNSYFCYTGTKASLSQNPDGTYSWSCNGSAASTGVNAGSSTTCVNKNSNGGTGIPSGCTEAQRQCLASTVCGSNTLLSSGSQTCSAGGVWSACSAIAPSCTGVSIAPPPAATNGVCGGAINVWSPQVPTSNFCSAGTPSAATRNDNGTYSWSCAGTGTDATTATCQNVYVYSGQSLGDTRSQLANALTIIKNLLNQISK